MDKNVCVSNDMILSNPKGIRLSCSHYFYMSSVHHKQEIKELAFQALHLQKLLALLYSDLMSNTTKDRLQGLGYFI